MLSADSVMLPPLEKALDVIRLLNQMPVPVVILPGVQPLMTTSPPSVADIIAFELNKTPAELEPVAHDCPVIEIRPELVVTHAPLI